MQGHGGQQIIAFRREDRAARFEDAEGEDNGGGDHSEVSGNDIGQAEGTQAVDERYNVEEDHGDQYPPHNGESDISFFVFLIFCMEEFVDSVERTKLEKGQVFDFIHRR